ncbi:MAG: DMT family transporter [Deinococcales bacterium]
MNAPGRGDSLVTLAAAGTGVQVGAAMVASRFALHALGSADLALLRYALALALVLPAALAARRRRWARRDVLPVALLGITQFGVVIVLLNLSLERLPAGLAALLFTTAPLQALLLASAIGQERLTRLKVVGALVALAGVALALDAPLSVGGGALAVVAALSSAFAAALCSVLYRPYLARYPVPQVGAVAMAAAVTVLLVPAAADGLARTAPGLSAATWQAVAFVGVSSGVGYLLWLWALGRAEASRVTLFLALGPITALLLGAAFLSEPLRAHALEGAALVALGLAVAHRKVRRDSIIVPRTKGS